MHVRSGTRASAVCFDKVLQKLRTEGRELDLFILVGKEFKIMDYLSMLIRILNNQYCF